MSTRIILIWALLHSGSVDGHALADFEFILAQLLPLQLLHDRVVEDLLEIIRAQRRTGGRLA
jgi:hypothetical protein